MHFGTVLALVDGSCLLASAAVADFPQGHRTEVEIFALESLLFSHEAIYTRAGHSTINTLFVTWICFSIPRW